MRVIQNKELELKAYDKTVVQDPNSPLPDPRSSFVALAIANKGAGKTTALLNMLLRKNFFFRKFDRVYLMVATLNQDKKWEKVNLKKLEGHHSGDWDEEALNEWYEATTYEVEAAKREEEDPPLTLVVIDDHASMLDKSPTLRHWVLNSRHARTSMILTTQKLSLAPTFLRTNADVYMVWPPHSANEKDKIKDELLSPYLNKGEIEEMTRKVVWQDPRDFLFINTRHDRDRVFYKKFDLIDLKG